MSWGFADDISKHCRSGMLDITGGGEEHELPAGRQLSEPRHGRCTRFTGQLCPIATGEIGEATRIVRVPATQIGARCHVLHPLVEVDRGSCEPSRPEPVDEHPVLVLPASGVFVHPHHRDPRRNHDAHQVRNPKGRAVGALSSRTAGSGPTGTMRRR